MEKTDEHAGDMLRTGKASQLLHLSPNTLRSWTDRGLVKAYRANDRGDRRYRREDLEALLR